MQTPHPRLDLDEHVVWDDNIEDISIATIDNDNESDLIQINEGELVSRLPNDIICSRGAQNANSMNHQRYLNKKDRYHLPYKNTRKRKVKQQYRNKLIRWVYYVQGGRFLKPVDGHDDLYRVMTFHEVAIKVSQSLSEQRKRPTTTIRRVPINDTDHCVMTSIPPTNTMIAEIRIDDSNITVDDWNELVELLRDG